jgi:hypothetical protein
MRRRLLACFVALRAAGCGAPDGVVDDCTRSLSLPAAVSTDILFVIDDSGSMQEEQEKVVARLGQFVADLSSAEVTHDFQLAAVTTSVLQVSRTCGDPTPFLVEYPSASGRLQFGKDSRGGVHPDSDRKILSSADPDLADQAARLLSQGTSGSGQEMALEAMRRALSPPLLETPVDATPPGNAGFLRPGARLLVVIVSDEDDCSDPTGEAVVVEPACGHACETDATCGGEGHYCVPAGSGRRCVTNTCETPEGRAALEPVETYVSFLRTLDDGTGRGRAREVFVAAIAPVSADGRHVPERCTSATDEAYGAGVRYRALVDALGERGFLASICEDDYGAALSGIAALVTAPQTLELEDAPPDGRLLLVTVLRASGEEISCRQGDGFSFEPATSAAPARVTLEGRCRLAHGDRVRVDLACAR